jgi:site-specific DNA recombinase
MAPASKSRKRSAGRSRSPRNQTKEWTTSTGQRNGGESFDKTKLHRVLRNAAYIGKVIHREKLYDGQHTAILDVEIFERTQKLLAEPHRPHLGTGLREYEFVLQGLVRCGPCN